MRRNMLGPLSGLLRQAASAADLTALPSSTRFVLPQAAFTAHNNAGGILYPENTTNRQGAAANWSRAAFTAAPTAVVAHEVYGVPDGDISDAMARQEFTDLVEYLGPKLDMARAELEQRILRAIFLGISAEGATYLCSAASPLPPLSSFRPIVEYLESTPGCSIGRLLTNAPYFLFWGVSKLPKLQENAAWLTEKVGLHGKDLGKIINSNAYALSRPVEDLERSLAPIEQLGVDSPQLRRVVCKAPRVLLMKGERVAERLNALRSVGMSESQVVKTITFFPGVLYISTIKVQSAARWLEQQGLPPATLANTVVRFPPLLAYNIAENLDPTLQFLKSEAKLRPDAIQRVLEYSPDTMGRAIPNLRENLDSLRVLGLNSDQISSVVLLYPGILRFSMLKEPFAAKIRFLTEVLGRDVGEALATNPMYVTYGMQRIATRGAFLMLKGRSTAALTSWLSWEDETFAHKLACAPLEEWLAYKATWPATPEAAAWLQPGREWKKKDK